MSHSKAQEVEIFNKKAQSLIQEILYKLLSKREINYDLADLPELFVARIVVQLTQAGYKVGRSVHPAYRSQITVERPSRDGK